MSTKPMIIGQNADHDMLELLQLRQSEVTEQQYHDVFDRRELVAGRRSAVDIVAEIWGTGRTVLLLGEEVRRAFGLKKLLVHPQEWSGCTWRQLPHPADRDPWYADSDNKKVASLLLEELYVSYVREMAA